MNIVTGYFAISCSTMGIITLGVPTPFGVFPLISFPDRKSFGDFLHGLNSFYNGDYNIPEIFLQAFKEEDDGHTNDQN